MQIRTMRFTDIDAAYATLHAAGLTTPREYLALYLELEPQGYIAVWQDDQMIGTVGALRYPDYAFIGVMAIHPAWQRQGVGKALLSHLLDDLARAGLPLAVLEATDKGFPLYQSFGFVEDSRTVVYRRTHNASDLDCQLARELVEPFSPKQLDELVALDAQAIGTRRERLLSTLIERYPERVFVARGRDGKLAGYAIASPNRVGPFVAVDARAAEALLDAAITLPFETGPVAALPGVNSAGAALLLRAGFDAERSTRRMWRGPQPPAGAPKMAYALASLGMG